MCGIVTVLGQITQKEITLFKQMLEVDSLRGRHSTGVIKVTADGLVSTKKKAVDGMDFVKLESGWISGGQNRVLIGHNRWATKGAVNDINAHPFTHDHIHGVHNGTLHTQIGLKDHLTFEVDSDNLFYDIAHGNTHDTVKKLSGAFAINLYNEKTMEVEVFRNSQRPLSMAVLNDGKTVVIASEYLMLEWLLDRNDYIHKDGTAAYKMIETIDTFKHIVFKPFANGKGGGIKNIIETMTIKKLEAKPVYVAPAVKKHVSTLQKEYGLDPLKHYPMQLIESHDLPEIGHEIFVWQMLCPPHDITATKVFTLNSAKELRAKIDEHGIVGGRLNIPHTSHVKDAEFTTYSTDIKKADVATLKLISTKKK